MRFLRQLQRVFACLTVFVVYTSIVVSCGCKGGSAAPGPGSAKPLEELQRSFVDLRFGLFLHFGILTYTGMWAQPNLDISQFNPTQLDANQWADAAVSAGMKFGVLVTRHHDGFALWPSQYGNNFNVSATPWKDGKGDVVREYVDAFRAHGLLPGLYYSVWDSTQAVGGTSTSDNTPVTREQVDYVKNQLTEILTNYGEIPLLFFDAWSWKMGHRQVPYAEIRALVKSLQPNCLMIDNSHLANTWENDLANAEEAQGNTYIPADNTQPAAQYQKINMSGGNDWFWSPSVGNLMDVSTIVNTHLKILEPRWATFILNCPPNRDGLLPAEIVTRLGEVGAAWAPDPNRPPLPAQPPQIDVPYDPVGATATSGQPNFAIDGLDDYYTYTVWEPAGALPQAITIDIGQVQPDVSVLNYVPRYVAQMGSSTDGAITSYNVYVSTDNATFTMVASGDWPATGHMKTASFDPVEARYIRLEATAVNGTKAAATEIAVGAHR